MADEPATTEAGRFLMDAILRKFGFTIHSRRTGSEPLWERDDDVYTEREALFVVKKESRESK